MEREAAATAKSLQSCPTLCNPIEGSPPGSPIPGILQARTLEWVALSFSNAWKWKVKVKSLNPVLLSVTPWTAAYQVPPSMGFSRQEYWSGVPLLLQCIKEKSESEHSIFQVIFFILGKAKPSWKAGISTSYYILHFYIMYREWKEVPCVCVCVLARQIKPMPFLL